MVIIYIDTFFDTASATCNTQGEINVHAGVHMALQSQNKATSYQRKTVFNLACEQLIY